MSEGWAEFFGNAVLEWQGIYSFFGEPEEYYAYCGYPYWQGCDFTNEDGTIVEGAVMQVLWDIYDKTTTNDGTVGFDDEGPDQDQLNFVNYLWNSLRFSYSITEFLSKWLQSGYPDISEIFDINIFGIKPPAPTNLTSNLQDESSVNLEWELNSIWEGQVYVYSRQEGGDYEIITSLPPNTSSLQCNLPVMGTYYFRVSSLTCDTPALSNETMVVTNFLNPPTNFTAISTYPWNYVELSWEDNSNYEDGYEIKRRTPGGNWVVLDTTGANETSFIDTMVSLFNEYAYKVRAIAPGASSSSIFTWAYDGPLTCSDGTAYSNSKKILISNGKVHMIYRNEALRVRYLSYSLYSGNLLEEVDLSSAAAGYYPLIIGKGGKLVAFWNGTYEDGDNRTEVYIASSIDNGESWSGPYECLESAPGDVIFLNLSATFDRTSDTVYLAVIDYYGHGGGSFYVFCVKLIDFDGYGDWMVDEIDTIGYFDGAMLSEIDGLTIGFDKVSSFPLIVLCLRDSLYYWGAGPPHENSFSSGFLCEGSSPSLDGRVLVYQDGDDIYLRVYNSGGMPAWSSAQYIGTGEAPSMTYYRGKAYVFYESDGLYLSYGVPNSVNWSEVLLEGDGNYISGAVVREYLLVDTAIIEGIGGSLGDSIYQVRGTNMKVFYLYTRLLMSGYGIGFGIRDIGSVGLTGGPQGLGEELIYAVYPASPNPFRDKMEVRFIIPEVSIVRFTIYDVTGRRVRTTVREFERGVHRVVWNGEDSMGRRVSPGIYFYRVEMDGIKGGGKVIYLR